MDSSSSSRAHRSRIAVSAIALVGVILLAVVVLQRDVRRTVLYEFESKAATPNAVASAVPPDDRGADAQSSSVDDVGAPPVSGSAHADEPANRVASGYVRLAVAGDVGTGGPDEYATASAMDRLEADDEFDALLLLGDNVYEDGDASKVPDVVFDPFADVLDGGTQLLPVLGNHDNDSGFGDAQVEALDMPGRWYSTLIDDVLIVSLDSTQPDNPDQLAWLTGELAWSPARWTIVELHHPPYSGGAHGSSIDVRDAFAPLFEEYGVQLVLAGHDHDDQRSEVINGVTYLVSGAAAKLRDAHRADFTEVAFSTYHFLNIAIWPDRIDVQAVDQRGDALDTVTIRNPHETFGGAYRLPLNPG